MGVGNTELRKNILIGKQMQKHIKKTKCFKNFAPRIGEIIKFHNRKVAVTFSPVFD